MTKYSPQPKTLAGWSKKLFVMQDGKFGVRVIGWKTPSAKGLFGLTIPRKHTSFMSEIPKSATLVAVAMIHKKDHKPSRIIRIPLDRLKKECYIV